MCRHGRPNDGRIGGQDGVHSSGKTSNSSVQSRRLHDAGQVVAILHCASSPIEGRGDKFVLEDEGKPGREKGERRKSNHPDGCIEDKQDLGYEEGNTPKQHSLWETEEERQVLETIDVMPAFGEVGMLKSM